jgi:hypothetical protein
MTLVWSVDPSKKFSSVLREQRWDDHRFYHQSRINQTLHFLSATSFTVSFGLLFTGHYAVAALLGWLVGMCSRQAGHFFFEPRGYDHANQVSDEYKEAVKVGYNIRRKIVLMSAWALSPLIQLADPSVFGLLEPHTDTWSFLDNTALIWLGIAATAILFRMLQLFFLRDIQTGVAWMTKILTDPFHDIRLYHGAPLALLRGEIIDPSFCRQPESPGTPAR